MKMFKTMKKLTLATTVSLIALSGAVGAKEMPLVSEIDVSASYDAAQDTNAQEMFPEITSDIALAIADLVPQSDDGADPIIRVDIRKVALNGDTVLPDSKEFNELEGVVSIETESGNGAQSFPVAIKAVAADGAVPPGYTAISPSLTDFYNAMVVAFAQNVAEEFADLNLVGVGSINR
ncbi:hypothetical protein AB2B41_14045 [Marimonas sp. MJW-29]|uniref:Uncharacterized protein n=1 Tax=Sulfitobacter sediminis TaxID=3234186 RepID=A0ABV3RQ94_9RHOB